MIMGEVVMRGCIELIVILGFGVMVARAAQTNVSAKQQAEKQADQVVQQAQKRLDEADRKVDSAQHDVEKAVDALRKEFENSSEWSEAQSAVKRAQADRDAAVKPLLDALHEQANYKAAMEEKNRCAAEVDRLRAAKASPNEMTAAATKSAQASGVLLRMEQEVVSNDVAAQAAIKKLAEANKRAGDLKAAFNESIKSKPAFTAARDVVNDARTERDKVAREVRQAQEQQAKARAEAGKAEER